MPTGDAPKHSWLIDIGAFIVLAIGVSVVYLPKATPNGSRALLGMDHLQLHMRRIAFAQEALFGPSHTLPDWYPRELLGTPYWSNVQNFPFIPTRLAVISLVGPLYVLTVSAIASAVFAAWFTYLFCRRLGLARLAAMAAAWTFACGGFYASRITAGHLPLLEAYPALPLLLWLSECVLQSQQRQQRTGAWLLALGLACAAMFLAGHPQLTIYAFIITVLYIVARGFGRQSVLAIMSMGLGVGCAAFALLPMFLLVRRSTRILPLAAADNDLALPYRRLAAFFFPWIHGWAAPVAGAENAPLKEGFLLQHFWDTVCYVGWLPWIVILAMAIIPSARRRLWERPWFFFVVAGVLALLLALPPARSIFALIPGTFLRSAARQLYIVTFVLTLLLGLGLDTALKSLHVMRTRSAALIAAGIGLLLLGHIVDLVRHDREFIIAHDGPPPLPSENIQYLHAALGNGGRIAVDRTFSPRFSELFDDVGFFDSVMLARPYRLVLGMSGAPPHLNTQVISGSQLSRRALQATGVRIMVTSALRPDLVPAWSVPQGVYEIPGAAERVQFFDLSRVQRMDEAVIDNYLCRQDTDPLALLMLSGPAKPMPSTGPASVYPGPEKIDYRRVSSDVIEVSVTNAQPGYLRIIESFDPGWRAFVDGAPAPIEPANIAFQAIFLQPGKHEVRLEFHTPGARAGIAVAVASLVCLIALAVATSFSRAGSGGAINAA